MKCTYSVSRSANGRKEKGSRVFVLESFRPSSWSEGRFHLEPFRHSPDPGFFAERAASLHTQPKPPPIPTQAVGDSHVVTNLAAAPRASR